MRKQKECACEPNSGELAVKAAMEAELSGEDENGDFALIVARLALQRVKEVEGNTTKLTVRQRQQWHGGAGATRWRSGVVLCGTRFSMVGAREGSGEGESERE